MHTQPTRLAFNDTSKPRVAGKWFRTLLLFILGSTLIPAAYALDVESQASFNIAPQRLATALVEFSRQANAPVVSSAKEVDRFDTRGVSGTLSLRDALQALLNGTGLEMRVTRSGAIAIGNFDSPTAQVTDDQLIRLAQVGSESQEKQADTGADSGSSTKNADGLEEVVVTATRRKESVQKLPQAITAVTSDRLDELNAQSFEDYFRDVPGLMLIDKGDGKRDFSLRGVSSAQVYPNPTPISPATVSQYVDEIPVTANGFQLDPRLVDIERVEVLRGPQGTYYGEGALAGTIRMITRKPNMEGFSGSVEGRISSTEDGSTSNSESLMLNLPLVSGKAALRLAGFYANDGGYLDLVALDSSGQSTGQVAKKDVNVNRSYGYRGALFVQATDSFSILAQAIHSESNTQKQGGYSPLIGDLQLGICPGRDAPAPPPGASCDDPTFISNSQQGNLFALTLSQDFGWATLVSATSYAKTAAQIDQAHEHTTGRPTTGTFLFEDLTGVTQELRLVSSPSWSQRWDYVVGAYYQDKDSKALYPPLPQLGAPSAGNRTTDLINKQTALFAETGYMFSERLQGRLGLRGSHLTNDSTEVVPVGGTQLQNPPAISSSFSPLTGRAVLDYFINRSTMLYTSVATGFRNGTLNNTAVNYSIRSTFPGFTPVPVSSDPDTNVTYEAGWKLSFPNLHRLSINGALYHTDWKKMQVMSYVTTDAGVNQPGYIDPGLFPAWVNASRSKVDGLEFEGGFEIIQGLQARFSWAVIDARLSEDFPMFLPGGKTTMHALKGDTIPFVARNSGSLGLSYRRSMFGRFDGFATVNAQYQGSRATDFNRSLNNPPSTGGNADPSTVPTYFEMDGYWTTNLQFGVQRGSWRAALTVANVLNQRADLFSRKNPVTGQNFSQITDRPRTIGFFLRHNFD